MGVVQVTVHQVIRMIAMGDGFMPAVGSMPVAGFVSPAVVIGRAIGRVPAVHLEPVIVDVILMGMVHVPVVQIVGVPVVHHGCMPAAGAMFVRMVRVGVVCHLLSSWIGLSRGALVAQEPYDDSKRRESRTFPGPGQERGSQRKTPFPLS
jgi:hypothetical protein